MQGLVSLTQDELSEFLLAVAPVRPVFIWGPPGVGKSALVEKFARDVGMECVALLGSQLASEDLIGVPQIVDGKSRFCPPTLIARDEPYVLFLDELNIASHDVQKAFYSLVHEHRIGEWKMPKGSVIIGAGNRATDSALVRPLPAPLVNRMVHVAIEVSHRQWLEWAQEKGLHPWVIEYIQTRPDHLVGNVPKTEEPFSTPRTWELLSDALKQLGNDPSLKMIEAVVSGTISAAHVAHFRGFVRQVRERYRLQSILKGDTTWPREAEQMDILTFLVGGFRAHLLKTLPTEGGQIKGQLKEDVYRFKALVAELAEINLELAQTVVSKDEDGRSLPSWFKAELVQQLPRIMVR